MKDFSVNIHSIIDIITNSSSEIFVGADNNTISKFKELINIILKSLNCEKTFDDLFEVEILDDDNENIDDIDLNEEYEIKPYLHLKIKDSNLNINITEKIYEIFDCKEYAN
jgi:hypothetical protein